MMDEKPNKPKTGPAPQRLKIEGDWESAAGKAIGAGKPPPPPKTTKKARKKKDG